MAAHADRDHATWSASSAKRNFACAGALTLIEEARDPTQPERTSEAADWGTCAHQISERCLNDGGDAVRFIGQTEKGKKFSFSVDDEMAECAQEFIDYVRAAAEGGQLWVEQRFSLAALKPPFDAGGTGDAVIYQPTARSLEVVDLKGGRGVVVEAKGNPQLRTYALGAFLANPGLDVETITVTIVQPRAPHRDGRVRSEAFHVADLLQWTVDMKAAMLRAKEAQEARKTMPESAWAAAYLCPGTHCRDTFCGVAATCPALEQKALDEVGVHFSPVDDSPQISNSPKSGAPEERARRLDMLDLIEGWAKAVRAYEHEMAEMGQPAPGYGLVEKQGREKFVDAEAEAKAIAAAKAAGLKENAYLNAPKARTPKQILAAMKKAKADVSVLAGLSRADVSGTNLVKLETSLRKPVEAPVNQHFKPID